MLTLARRSGALARTSAVRCASSAVPATSSSSAPAERGNIQDLLNGNATARNGVGTRSHSSPSLSRSDSHTSSLSPHLQSTSCPAWMTW